ncbi:rod shape-determining protein [Candidatus Berkelbacteria bacterium CG06_land_8_20_14_3_00_43_10]|uniref:Cell shape-determining protein MreB n=1 Tax=Candidatus Berkelbacteria bacterium CG10_big_fil_rev_8_21_14_0_10_43_14 TaxID=1974515 RepID=A0A2M6R885_9BACT|nr:MAG: rod shape-determining protein [Candidatus Berkelbacteria bacterium CG10_big_fil_rev_8_21_14_0_10_43_14]PIU87091.1 MAG: rod shape-determining protein [Candidatus Berkelbacteria bacterium CG06_land_8_20_14_3_00_43_10]
MFIRKVGIDLGTTNILVYVPGKGIIINEPSVVVLDATTNKIMAIGKEAKEMLGRTPDSLLALHPLRDGAIANYRVTETMLKYFLNKVGGRVRLIKPDIMIAVPAGVTSTERRAVVDASLAAGAKNAYLIKEPVAAALGAGIAIGSSTGNMIIDIGGGTSEVAVIALGDIVASTSVRVAGLKIDTAIANYIRKKYNLIIGDQTAENVKIQIGAASPIKKELTLEVSGSNAVTGLPESVIVSTNDVIHAVRDVLQDIISAVKDVLQKTPPELASDVMDKGIVMTGGGSQLRNLDQLMTKVTGVPCQTAEDPQLAVAKGTGIAVEHLVEFKRSVLWSK